MACLSPVYTRTRLCDADSTGQTSTQGRLRSLIRVVLGSTLATVLAKDLLGEVLCLALLTIYECDVNGVFCGWCRALHACLDHIIEREGGLFLLLLVFGHDCVW